MLKAITPDETISLIRDTFKCDCKKEVISINEAFGRVLAEDIVSSEDIPGFDRTTIDGYALKACDTFGCSDSIPAILSLKGDILMGKTPNCGIDNGECMSIPTGGMMPDGADAAVMIEYTEDYGDGTIGVLKPVAPGENLIFRGDDVKKSDCILHKGTTLKAHDIGTLAALGICEIIALKRPLVGIISTGDELVPINEMPTPGQIRDVNSSLLNALITDCGAIPKNYGIIKDDEITLSHAVDDALLECDIVVISGGSSVGTKDATCRVIESRGELLLHGVAMKPGKPTILGDVGGKPVFGLPGHPAAAFFVAEMFLREAIAIKLDNMLSRKSISAVLTEPVSANHGRAQYTNVKLDYTDEGIKATPIRSKSGLITSLSASDGYFCILRDVEGVAAGEIIDVFLFS